MGFLHGRVTRVATAVLGLALLGVALVSTVTTGRAAATRDLDHALNALAFSNASALQEYFERAKSINLILANDSVFQQFGEPGWDGSSPTQVRTATAAANAAIGYLEDLYPGRISETCVIKSSGTELARVVRGVVAPASELSNEEAKAPFFAPTMAVPTGRVYQAAPYISPDTDQWVISNSTPMVGSSGDTWGMVHFEVALDSFRPAETDRRILKKRQGFSASIVDTRTGQILLESGRPVAGTTLGRGGSAGLRALVAQEGGTAAASLDGRRVAVARVSSQQDNVNSWSVVVSAPTGSVSWSKSIGPASVAMGLAALALLAFAGLNLGASHRRLRQLSLTDELTGLANRRLLADRLHQALLIARRRGTTCAVLLIDLDRFKEVNDTLGHHHGDQLLCRVADRLAVAFRESDTVARLGGDEFAVLLPEVADEAAAMVLARRCVAALHEAFLVEGVTLNVEASTGLALAPQHGSDANQLLRAADVAMYEAKERKCGVVVYDPDLDVNTPIRLALLGDLRRALHDDELFLLYQPKVNLSTDEVRSVEALVRWQHPSRGLVPPAEFVPLAEGTGLILPLTLRTLDLAITQARRWLDDGQEIQVAVNLSTRCLLEPEFPAMVHDLLDRHGLPARLLRLEITESTIMADPDRSLALLTELQQSGISLSIDDFGTGYSSMSYLKRLPVDELKIDRSFVLDMLANSSGNVLVRSSIDLGHNLGLTVVAEGVEDQPTLAALSALGCDVAQGYHLGTPMTSPMFNDWLEARTERLPASWVGQNGAPR